MKCDMVHILSGPAITPFSVSPSTTSHDKHPADVKSLAAPAGHITVQSEPAAQLQMESSLLPVTGETHTVGTECRTPGATTNGTAHDKFEDSICTGPCDVRKCQTVMEVCGESCRSKNTVPAVPVRK